MIKNLNQGRYIIISKELFEIVNTIINDGIDYNYKQQLTNNYNFEDESDTDILVDIFETLIKEHFFEEINDKRISNIHFSITNRCNLRCIHCCMDSSCDTENGELSTEDLKIAFNNISELNPECIVISGGEPMVRKDFFEVCEYLRKIFSGKITLSTNATLFKEDNINRINSIFDSFEISLDGIDEDSCALVRGRGIFSSVVRNIKMLRSISDKEIFVSMVFGDKNEHLKGKFYELNKSLKTLPHERGFFSVGRGNSVEAQNTFLKKGSEDYYLFDDYFEKNMVSCSSCKAGVSTFMIDSIGNIYPCPSLMYDEFYCGNIVDTNLKLKREWTFNKIFNKVLASSDEYVFNSCKDCSIKDFCWSCPGEMMDLREYPKSIDKKCSMLKRYLEDVAWKI